jgi:beta-lactamase class A
MPDFGDSAILEPVNALLAGFPGELGFYAKNLTTGEEVWHRPDEVMPTASVIKVGIMAELYRQIETGLVDPATRLTVTAEDYYGGTGVLKEFETGIQPTVTDLCRLMIIVSDNVATGMLVRLLGKERINRSFAEWGLPNTRLIMNMKLGGDIREYAVSTARELGRLYELIATDGFLTPASCETMRYHLSRQQHLEQIPRDLPYHQYASELGIEQPLSVMNKIGNYPGVRVDAAIVKAPSATFVIATMNEGSPDPLFQVDHEGNVLNGRVARIVFDRWVPELTLPSGWG